MIGSSLMRFYLGEYCPFDCEGESLNLHASRPWELAWGVATNKGILQSKSRFIWWPDLRMSADAARITHFDFSHYKATARPAREVWDEFSADLTPARRIVWQNGLNYDHYMLRNLRRALGLADDDSYLMRSIDTNCLLKARKKRWVIDTSTPEAFLAWQYRAQEWHEKGLKTNLTDAARELRIPVDTTQTHGADYDIRLMFAIYQQLLVELEF